MAKKAKNPSVVKPGKNKKRAAKKKAKAKRKSKTKPKPKRVLKPKTKLKPAKPKKKRKEKKEAREPGGAKVFVTDEPIKRTKIRVIGIGGGGGTIVSEISSRIQKASFVAANTDTQALRTSGKKVVKFHFGQNLTQGLGTGMNANLGQEAALQEKEKIAKLLDGQDLTIFVVSLGGGTGSGAAPVFAKISRSLGNLNYGIFTLPFNFEGEKKMEIALESLKRIRPYLNAFSVVPNERVFQAVDKNAPLKEALSAVNKILTDGLEGLIETIYEPGLINIDFADFRTVLEGQGRLTYLNTASVSKNENSAQDLLNKAVSCPLYPYGIRGAKGVLFNISGEKDLGLSEVNQISKNISDLANKDAKIIFGISQDGENAGQIKITLLATGCALKTFRPESQKPKLKIIRIIRKENPENSKDLPPEKPPAPAIKQKNVAKKSAKETKKANGKAVVSAEKKQGSEEKRDEKNSEAAAEQREMVRKNALQLRREVEAEEKEIEAKEQVWDTPAFLRQRK